MNQTAVPLRADHDRDIYDPASGDEVALINGLCARDPDAYAALVREYGAEMFATARRCLACIHDAEDAAQDALISAFQSIHVFNRESRLSTWLHRIVVNACLMKLRSRGRRSFVGLAAQPGGPDVAGADRRRAGVGGDCEPVVTGVAAAESRAHVRACIDQLPASYRTVLVLRDIEELDTCQTARLLKTTRANVKTRLYRARQTLKPLLEPLVA
ncbi:MAG TPA: sigma-70 family RNA polymerase sigma factor [Tepidisphaeraceae bacterium]|jgi:RNA polymerase sigma-70 factor (ECF subfamily)